MRRLFLTLWLLVSGVAMAIAPIDLGKVQTKDHFSFEIYAVDTLPSALPRRPDSVSVKVFKGRQQNGTAFFYRTGSNAVNSAYVDSMKDASEALPTYSYHDSIGRIDADSGTGLYTGSVRVYYQTWPTIFEFVFTIVDSSEAVANAKAARDSAIVDRSSLLLYTGNFNTAYSTFNYLTDSVTFDRSNTLLYLGNFNTTYSTLTASDNIGINWADVSNPTSTLNLSATRIFRLNELDEDNTTIDLDATTVGGGGGGGSFSMAQMDSVVRKIFGDSLATFGDINDIVDSLRDVFGDSARVAVLPIKNKTDSLLFAGALQNPSFLRPTTGGRYLDVSSGGEAGIDWANIGSPTSTQNLSATRIFRLNELDEDNTTIDLDATSVAGGGGGGSGWNGYPLLQKVTIVDAPGTLTKYQFVIDTTSCGGSNEYALLNRAVTVRDTSTDAGKVYFRGVIERANCVADMCTLQIADSCAFAISAGDSVWIWGDRAEYVFATVSEAAVANRDSLLTKDLTGSPQDSTFRGLLKIAALVGGSSFDSTDFLTMWQNHGWYSAMDLMITRFTKGHTDGLPVNSELFTQPQFEAFGLNVEKINSSTTPVINLAEAFDGDGTPAGRIQYADSAGNAGTTLTSDQLDTLAARIAAAGISCTGSGAEACTLYVFQSSTAKQGVFVRARNSSETSTEAEGYTDANGMIVFNLDATSYKIRTYRAGLSQTTNPQTVTVSASGANDTILVSEVGIGSQTALFSMTMATPLYKYAEVRYTLANASGDIPIDTSSNSIIPTVLYDSADSMGVIATTLYKNSNIYLAKKKATGSTSWTVTVRPRGSESWDNAPINMTVFVPSDSTYFRPFGGM